MGQGYKQENHLWGYCNNLEGSWLYLQSFGSNTSSENSYYK